MSNIVVTNKTQRIIVDAATQTATVILAGPVGPPGPEGPEGPPGAGGGGAWGTITGTMSDQTDLQTALNGKATTAQGALADSALQPADGLAVLDAAADTKLDYITVTQAVNLDTIETRVNELDASVVLMGTWDASAGTFPGAGIAQAGQSWIVSVGGTVGGTAFTANDRIVAIADNASTTVYAANWHKLDYTDAVLSFNGATGAVTGATTAQGALADTALQPADGLASLDSAAATKVGHLTVTQAVDLDTIETQAALGATALQTADVHAAAISGSYNDLDDLPPLGTAAAEDTSAFAVPISTAIETIWIIGTGWRTNGGTAVITDTARIRHYSSTNDASATTPIPYNIHDIWDKAIT